MFRLRSCRPRSWSWRRWLLVGVVGFIVIHLLPFLEMWREKRIVAQLRQEGVGCGLRNLRDDLRLGRLSAVEPYFRWVTVPCNAHFPYETDVNARTISRLRSLPFLECLDFGQRSFHGLQALPRAGRFVNDGDLQEVGRLTQLRELAFHYSDITDEGLRHLSGLHRLRILSLKKTGISDAGLIHVGKLTSLRRLNLQQTNVTGTGLQHLRSLKELYALSLQSTPLDVDTLASLAALPKLQRLDLDLVRVNDESIDRLAQLTSLKSISVTDISDQGFDRLRRAMPACVVERGPSLW